MAGDAEVLSKHTRLALALAGDPKGRSGKDAVHLASLALLARDIECIVPNKANCQGAGRWEQAGGSQTVDRVKQSQTWDGWGIWGNVNTVCGAVLPQSRQ